MDLILLGIFSYALYRMAVSNNITPWKWIIRYVSIYLVSFVGLAVVLISIYGQNFAKDMEAVRKMSINIMPFALLYEVLLFFFFRGRIVKYVHDLDQIDKISNTPPSPPQPPKKEDKDLSYFR